MTIAQTTLTENPTLQKMLRDVVEGLSKNQKTLPSKYFYDERGSKLFDDICELDEYYVTRTESKLMQDRIGEISAAVGPNALLVEYGSGSSLKTRLLLRNLSDLKGYVPIDISGEYLSKVGHSLQAEFPDIEVLPLVADFTEPFDLPTPSADPDKRVVYFPGSTIGNFQRDDAIGILAKMAGDAGSNGGILIGVDLDKDREVLHRAYNDARGVTAQFNLNILRRINEELGGTFDVSNFRHEAVFNEDSSCVEMHLISTEHQTVEVCEFSFNFEPGETILTEYSHKYTIDAFSEMAAQVGLEIRNNWTDENKMFAVLYLEPNSRS